MKATTTEEELEEASERRDREDWFKEGGCPELSKRERWSGNDCGRNGVNPAISAKGQYKIKLNYYY